MATKLQFYQAVSEQAAKDVTAHRGNWTGFLDSAAKLYKYTFPEQLLIHAQKPDAAACASLDTWNDSFNRWVKRGTKGIALIDDTGSYPRLKYVFDVSDTEPSLYNSRPVYLWEMRQEHKELVLEHLAGIYDDVGDTLADSFRNIAKQLAREYYEDNAREIRFRAEDSFLEDFDNFNFGVAFEDALTNSIAYTIMSRCGFDTGEYFEDEDFRYIFNFNTPDMVHALGTASAELSQQVLRDIENVIKKYERQHAAERSVTNEHSTDIQASRGLSSPGHQTERAAEGTDSAAGTVREDEESVPERPPDDNLQLNAAERNTVPAPSGNGGSGEREAGTGDEPADREERTARQGERPDGLDGGDEHVESTGGGNGAERTDLQIDEASPESAAETENQINANETPPRQGNEPEPGGVSASARHKYYSTQRPVSIGTYPRDSGEPAEIVNYDERIQVEGNTIRAWGYLIYDKPLTEAQIRDYELRAAPGNPDLIITEQPPQPLSQVGTRLMEAISTSSVTMDEVDSILRDGGNSENSVLRIAAHFSKGLTPEENAAFLRREYLMGRYDRREEEPGGKGFQFGSQQTAVWFDENGILIGRGKSALSASDRAHITWEQAAERVKALYDAGQYVSHDVLDEALYNESAERANDIIEIYKNLTRGISDIQYELKKGMDKEQKEALKDDWKDYCYLIRGLAELESAALEAINGENPTSQEELMHLYNETIRLSEPLPPEWNFPALHPEIDERMTELLRDRSENGGYNQVLNRLREDVAALLETPDAPIRFYRNPRRALNNLEKAGLPAHGFPVTDYQPLNFMRFITNDEVDHYLAQAGRYSEGKLRVLSHFLHDHTPQERVKFLKDQYGHGGGTWLDGWSNAEPGKGIKLQRAGCEDVNLNWNQATRRTDELIKSGRYATRQDLNNIPDYEALMLARYINNFYYNLPPEEYERPFSKELDFHYPHEDEWTALLDFLGDNERVDAVLAQMLKPRRPVCSDVALRWL